MSIQDVQTQFKAEASGKVALISATMHYQEGGKIQEFAFRVSHKGAATTIEIPADAADAVSAIVSQAVAKALAWAEKTGG